MFDAHTVDYITTFLYKREKTQKFEESKTEPSTFLLIYFFLASQSFSFT